MEAEVVDQASQLEEVLETKGGAAGGQDDDGVRGEDARPAGRERDLPADVVVAIDAILAPVVAVGDQGELAPEPRMERVGNSEGSMPTVTIGCS